MLSCPGLQDGVKRHKALLSQQTVLKETMESMQAYEEKLVKAEAHLKNTKSKLDKSLWARILQDSLVLLILLLDFVIGFFLAIIDVRMLLSQSGFLRSQKQHFCRKEEVQK